MAGNNNKIWTTINRNNAAKKRDINGSKISLKKYVKSYGQIYVTFQIKRASKFWGFDINVKAQAFIV
jgi:hypothetical protein